eukprot:CAMPEP_0171339658 /NCGR_PEP_ID=MMETSP0878-20121228/8076_1 /TAXON_ID=67004 /ORGANISM="Thalassiosira weissflogii, Strain CCMP1336" /LENGTH=361 /DNA_ID=CAMNT_0011841595 /DNA_START=65 /DNA_END=1147 /DNA_ORIENTATION=+
MSPREGNDIEITAQEAKQIKKALEDDSFRKLMTEYVNEISDPKFREEQEAYIRQLEANEEVPDGKSVIRPCKGFVIKCGHIKKRDGENPTTKLFINIVYSEKVSEPESVPETTGIREIRQWSVPFFLGPLRMEHDKAQSLVPTFDCCFNPKSLQYAHKMKGFCDLIVDIAKDAVIEVFRNTGDEIRIDKKYKILKGVQYKSGMPKAMLIKSGIQKSEVPKSHVTPPLTVDNERNELHENETVGKNENSENDTFEKETVNPKYEIIEQGVFDLADHTVCTIGPMSRRPKHLAVNIYLEGVESASEISIDVSEKNLMISSKPKCKFDIQSEIYLPYPVIHSEGTAKFHIQECKLVVSLGVRAE